MPGGVVLQVRLWVASCEFGYKAGLGRGILTATRIHTCSVDCQKAHWREHKARCKEVQAAKAAASVGGASTSAGGS